MIGCDIIISVEAEPIAIILSNFCIYTYYHTFVFSITHINKINICNGSTGIHDKNK